MAALRAVLVALSLVAVAILYSDIVENEATLEEEDEDSGVRPFVSSTSADTGWSDPAYDQLLTGDSGSLQSPNYPTADHKVDYVWLIKVPSTNIVQLIMLDFNSEPGFDYIFIHDGVSTSDPLLLVHSGPRVPSAIRSTGPQMLVRFVTDNKVNSRGFQANYYSVPPCSSVVHSSSGLITSPNYPHNYDSNLRCDWLVIVGKSEQILFEFIDVNTEEDYDVIQVYDGDSEQSPFLRRISGNHRDEVILQATSSNVALIRFTTDISVSKTGFAVKFVAGSQSDLVQYFMAEYPDILNELEPLLKANSQEGMAEPHQEDDTVAMADLTTITSVLKAALNNSNLG